MVAFCFKILDYFMDASAPFKWLDMLEQEFDRNYAFVDILLDEADFEDSYAADGGSLSQIRQRLSYISGAFGQLVHKSLTIFQSNLKLEARLLAAEEDAAQSEARANTLAEEVKTLKAQLAAVASLNPQKSASLLVEESRPDPEIVKLLDDDAQRRMLSAFRAQLAIAQFARLKKENAGYKYEALFARSEVEALKLTLRYLDKERAGRIQQIQLLSNTKMPIDERNRVWAQLETEIALQRCKTVVQTCLIRQQKTPPPQQTPSILSPHPPTSDNGLCLDSGEPIVGEIRTVKYDRPTESGALGLSIVGGRDVALPIIISSVAVGSPLYGQLFVGDLIKMANGIDLTGASRNEAVEAIVNPHSRGPNDKFDLTVCFLGGADDSDYDEALVATGSLNSSHSLPSGLANKTNVSKPPLSDIDDHFETVWLQNGELWPTLYSGVSIAPNLTDHLAQNYSLDQHHDTGVPIPPLLLPNNDVPTEAEFVLNEKILQASASSSSAAALFSSIAGSSRPGSVVTLKKSIQPREDDVVEDLVANFNVADISNSNTSFNLNDNRNHDGEFSQPDYSSLGDIAFSADV